MHAEKIFNLGPGPAKLPTEVKERLDEARVRFPNTKYSLDEIPHRHPIFVSMVDGMRERMRRLLDVPPSHEIAFVPGGATSCYVTSLLNLLNPDLFRYSPLIGYNRSGHWGAEAAKYGFKLAREGKCKAALFASSISDDYRAMARIEPEALEGFDILHTVTNETVNGTQDALEWLKFVKAPLICDMSSDIMSRPVDLSRIAIAYAGTQKNLGIPANLGLCIVDRELLADSLDESCPYLPPPQNFLEQLTDTGHGALRNTVDTNGLYSVALSLEWIEGEGGVAEMERRSLERASKVYGVLDSSEVFEPLALPGSRSRMNFTFRLRESSRNSYERFLELAETRNILGLRGHRGANTLYGPHYRASLYNAADGEDLAALLELLYDFERML